MGLFDSFHAEVECPTCKKKVEVEFQTKALLRLLEHFHVGDQVEFEWVTVKDGEITDALGSCPSCETLLTAKIVIKNNCFVGVKGVRKAKTFKLPPKTSG